jgi:hypothetical protein
VSCLSEVSTRSWKGHWPLSTLVCKMGSPGPTSTEEASRIGEVRKEALSSAAGRKQVLSQCELTQVFLTAELRSG